MMIATAKATGLTTTFATSAVRARARLADELPAGGRRDDRLEHDDRAVDEEAEVDRAEAHQVTGDAEEVHPEERDRHRDRDAHAR